MNTATQTAPVTELADRFRCESEVPDPPRDAAGRKQYWEDTVAEAVAELRRRLASTRDEKSFQALQMIVDLEKTRLRHKEPVAGTEVESRWSSGLGSMEDSTSSGGKYQGPKARTEDLTPPAPPATLSVPERVEELVPLPGGRGSQDNAVPLPPPSPERGVESSAPIRPTDNGKGEEVGPDGLTADLRAWIQEGHDYYDRLDAARAAGERLVW